MRGSRQRGRQSRETRKASVETLSRNNTEREGGKKREALPALGRGVGGEDPGVQYAEGMTKDIELVFGLLAAPETVSFPITCSVGGCLNAGCVTTQHHDV
eukprot:842498-Rhodomonas_salina.2